MKGFNNFKLLKQKKAFFWINQLQAMDWIEISWEKVTIDTIKNSWRHTTLLHPNGNLDKVYDLPETIKDNVVDTVKGLQFDFEENSGIFMNPIAVITEGEIADIDARLVEEDDCQYEKEEDDEKAHHVKQEDLVNAMKFVMDNIVAKTDVEFETLEAFSELYTSRRDEMISNIINQTTTNSYF